MYRKPRKAAQVTHPVKHPARAIKSEDIERVENKRKAIALRHAGASYDLIADTLGISLSMASTLVREAYNELRDTCLEETQLIVEIETTRLDELQMAHWQKRADPKHAEVILRVMERRARLLGLDKPEKRELTGANGEPLIGEDIAESILGKLFGGVADTSTGTSPASTSEAKPE